MLQQASHPMTFRLGLGNGPEHCDREGNKGICNVQSFFGFACEPREAFWEPSISNRFGAERVGVKEPGIGVARRCDCYKVPTTHLDSFDAMRLHVVIEETVLVFCNQYVYLFYLDSDCFELLLLLQSFQAASQIALSFGPSKENEAPQPMGLGIWGCTRRPKPIGF